MSQPDWLTVKINFLVGKPGLPVETCGKSERNKYRAVIYYMLTRKFDKESVYG